VALSEMEGEIVGKPAIKYLNRLSDLLFVAARWSNDKGAADVLWKPGATR
jgi:cob(I)alamin adenosyltransferase